MKKKFESNVATELPKTRSREPSLPWKLDQNEMAKIGAEKDDVRAMLSGTSPLRTRASFLILLVITIFGVTAYLVSEQMIENERMRKRVAAKDSQLSAAEMKLMRVAAEKDAASKNSAQMEKKLSDLSAQKQLFTSVIETLTKKGEDIDAAPSQNTAQETTTSQDKVTALPINPKQ